MNALDMLAHAFQVLGISHHASKTEITRAYRELARKHHLDKSPLNQELAAEEFKRIRNARDLLMDAITVEDPTESRNAGQFAASIKRAAAWLQPDYIPTFEVAYPGPKWYPVNEEISKEMYTAYLANTPGHYTEPLTANGKREEPESTLLTGNR